MSPVGGTLLHLRCLSRTSTTLFRSEKFTMCVNLSERVDIHSCVSDTFSKNNNKKSLLKGMLHAYYSKFTSWFFSITSNCSSATIFAWKPRRRARTSSLQTNRDDKHTFASLPAIRNLKGELEDMRLTFSRSSLLLIHTSPSPGE